MTDNQFKVIFVKKLGTAFPHEELSQDRIKLYWDHFKECSPEKFSEAVNLSIKGNKFFPKVSELYTYIDNATGILSFDETYLAINEIIRQVHKNGSYSSKDQAEIVNKVIDRAGYLGNIMAMSGEDKDRILRKIYKDVQYELRKNKNNLLGE